MFNRVRGLALAVLLLALAACDAVGLAAPSPTTETPEGTVRLALAAVTVHDWSGLLSLTCSLKKDDAFVPFIGVQSRLNAGILGISDRELFDAVTLTWTDVSTKEVSRTETGAVVSLSGSGTPVFDNAKMTVLFKRALKTQGVKVTDAKVKELLASLNSQQAQKIRYDLDLAKKGATWQIC